MASVIAKATGRFITYVAQSESEARAALLAAGLPTERVERRPAFHSLARKGLIAQVAEVLGRPQRSLREFAATYAHVWRA
jgi:hypothetical protein